MNPLNMTPEQIVAAGLTAWASRGPDGRHDTGHTVMVQAKGEAPEEFDSFTAEAMALRIPERLRRSCPVHGNGRGFEPRPACNCAAVFRSQVIAAVVTVKANRRRAA